MKDIFYSTMLVSFVVLVLISMNASSPIAQAADTESSAQTETWTEGSQSDKSKQKTRQMRQT